MVLSIFPSAHILKPKKPAVLKGNSTLRVVAHDAVPVRVDPLLQGVKNTIRDENLSLQHELFNSQQAEVPRFSKNILGFDGGEGFHPLAEFFIEGRLPNLTLEQKNLALVNLQDKLKKVNTSLICGANLVFASGNPMANLMIIGEAPGEEEDRQQIPFVGTSGVLLREMLNFIGYDDSNMYVTNVVNYRPPQNKTPTDAEIAIFLPYLLEHVSIIDPKIILLVGGVASKALLQKKLGVLSLRGRFFEKTIFGKNYRVLPTLHPAYVLRAPLNKKLLFYDTLLLQNYLKLLKI